MPYLARTRIARIRKRLEELHQEMLLDEEPPRSLQAELARQARIQKRAMERQALLAELQSLQRAFEAQVAKQEV